MPIIGPLRFSFGRSGPSVTLVDAGRVRVSQNYLEVIEDGGNNKVRVSQSYLEVIEDGGNTKVRTSQQYLEVIVTFGTPPVTPEHGKSKDAPGHTKGSPTTSFWGGTDRRYGGKYSEELEELRREANAGLAIFPELWVPPDDRIMYHRTTEIITLSDQGRRSETHGT